MKKESYLDIRPYEFLMPTYISFALQLVFLTCFYSLLEIEQNLRKLYHWFG